MYTLINIYQFLLQLSCEDLKSTCHSIAELLLLPWINTDGNKKFKTIIEDLVFQMNKYISFLSGMRERELKLIMRKLNLSETLRTTGS
jgi:hypothetical protein